jgi:hypothetical protein
MKGIEMTEIILRLHPGDKTVDGAEKRLASAGRAVVTEASGIGGISALGAGDTLFILAHGSPTSLGGYSATDLAALLALNNLKSGVNIQLVACNSGSGRAPFSLELKVALVSKKIVPASIQGGTNYMQVKSDGSISIADFNWSTKKWSAEIQDGSETVMTPWGPQKKLKRRQV